MIKARVLGLAVAMLSGWGMLVANMPDAQAQSSRYRYMSCDELWYSRRPGRAPCWAADASRPMGG